MPEAVSLDADLTIDAFLGGRLKLRQPRRGHRAGIEAVLIAAAAPISDNETILDIGAGVGAAGLSALARVPGTRATLVEADPALVRLASENVALNGFTERARVVACNVAQSGTAERFSLSGTADHALANPPFHDPGAVRLSPHKQAAHSARAEALDSWMRFAAAVLRPGGTLTLIHHAEALALVLSACSRRFGELRLVPLHPRAGHAASRIIVQGRKGRRGSLRLLPGFALHGPSGSAYTPRIEAVLRGGAALDLAGDPDRPHLSGAGDPPA